MSKVASYSLKSPVKLVRGLVIVGLAISFSMAGINGSVATSEQPAPLDYITVGYGESLWDLAEVFAQDQDPRDWIAEVVAVNALSTTVLEPGQRIALPR
ncbi:MAG: hypothetical protein EBS38_00765 [Actinobacteria bacterium]|nr:hypothetical protein [Actinomycetota bacterium]